MDVVAYRAALHERFGDVSTWGGIENGDRVLTDADRAAHREALDEDQHEHELAARDEHEIMARAHAEADRIWEAMYG